MHNEYIHGTGQPADLVDTGVSNGTMIPGQAAKLGAWLALAAVLLIPIAL